MKGTLLFVEDDRDDEELTLLGFKQQGLKLEVVVARDGQFALERLHADLAASRPLPAAILSDLKMPRMDGLDLLRRLRDEPALRGIPVGFLSSSSTEADKTEALRLGARFYMQKPSNLNAYGGLVGLINEMVARGQLAGA